MIKLTSLTIKSLFLSIICVLTSAQLYADDDKPRYLSGDGEDEGDCRNVFRPCRSLDYALSAAGKGDSILVGPGEYAIQSADEYFSLVTASHRIKASMDKLSGYSRQDKTAHMSTLMGVPASERNNFEALGFRVIADSKGLVPTEQDRLGVMLQKMSAVKTSHGRADCVANSVGTYPCQSVNLFSHLDTGDLLSGANSASDIWGFQDLNTLREYIIIGLVTGAAVVDVTAPENPQVIGVHRGLSSTWRDIKILQTWDATSARWRAYAYVSTEANMGIAILDLSGLPNSIAEPRYVSDFATAHNVYLANADYSFGVAQKGLEPTLIITGTNLARGRSRFYDLSTPANPELSSVRPTVDTDSESQYIHDAASVNISDDRKEAYCNAGSAMDYCTLLADFNEDSIEIWDISNPESPQFISSRLYSGARYVHSGWWSEDGRYLYAHDELDETNAGLFTTVRVFNADDLTSLELIGSWQGPTRAIDHNGFVRGNRYYMSNYTEGLTVLDISQPNQPERVGYFDSVPATSSASFAGAWGVFPFLPSGTLAISDMPSGLYLLEDDTTNVSDSVAFSSAHYSGVEGETIDITIERTGSVGALSVGLESVNLNASENDASLAETSVSWNDGESGARTLSLMLSSDGEDEDLEQLALRLISPQGTAAWGYPNISMVTISDGGQQSVVQALTSSVEVPENNSSAFVTLQRKGSTEGSVSVDWQLNVDGVGSGQNGTLNWEDGDARPLTIELANSFTDNQQVIMQLQNSVGATLGNTEVSLELVPEQGGSGGSSGSSSSGGSAGNNNAGSGGGGSMTLMLLALLVLSVFYERRLIRQSQA